MKTGLEILEQVISSFAGGDLDKVAYFSMPYYYVPITTFYMYHEGIVCTQEVDVVLKGTKEVPVEGISKKTRTLKWEEQYGVLLNQFKGYDDFKTRERIWTVNELTLSLPKMITEFGEQWKLPQIEDPALVVPHKDSLRSPGDYLVRRSAMREQMRTLDRRFTETLKPKTKYCIKGGTFKFTFPNIRYFEPDGRVSIDFDNPYDYQSMSFENIDIDSSEKIAKNTNDVMLAIKNVEGNLKELFAHYKSLDERFKRESQKVTAS